MKSRETSSASPLVVLSLIDPLHPRSVAEIAWRQADHRGAPAQRYRDYVGTMFSMVLASIDRKECEAAQESHHGSPGPMGRVCPTVG